MYTHVPCDMIEGKLYVNLATPIRALHTVFFPDSYVVHEDGTRFKVACPREIVEDWLEQTATSEVNNDGV